MPPDQSLSGITVSHGKLSPGPRPIRLASGAEAAATTRATTSSGCSKGWARGAGRGAAPEQHARARCAVLSTEGLAGLFLHLFETQTAKAQRGARASAKRSLLNSVPPRCRGLTASLCSELLLLGDPVGHPVGVDGRTGDLVGRGDVSVEHVPPDVDHVLREEPANERKLSIYNQRFSQIKNIF